MKGLRIAAALLGVGVMAAGARAQSRPYAYRHISLDEATVPGAVVTVYMGLSDDGRAFGNAFICATPEVCEPKIVMYRRGVTTVLAAGNLYAVNATGLVGGSVIVDPVNFVERAALFSESRGVELIPRPDDDLMSHVLSVADNGLALVEALDASFTMVYFLYHQGRVTPLDFGAEFGVSDVQVNERGEVSGTMYGVDGARAFRHDSVTGETTVLNPLSTEPESWGLAINSNGEVLGYSFVPGAIERVGWWDRNGLFHTAFVEGTEQYPTVSNDLLWNQAGLIVITKSFREDDPGSYIVPQPGVRLSLADITTGPLPPANEITDVNSRGDLLGMGGSQPFVIEHQFILERL
jgi:hypothetical protein